MRPFFLITLLSILSFNANAQKSKIDFLKDSTAVLFTGYDNHILIPKGTTLTLADQFSGCTVAKLNDITYSIKLASSAVGKKVKLKVIQKGKITQREYMVKVMPKMYIFIGGINAETQHTISKANFISHARNGIRFGYEPDAMIRESYPVKKYHVVVKVSGLSVLTEDVENGKFSEKALKLFKDQKKYSIECTAIYAEGSSGLMRNMEGFKLEVKE